MTTSKRGGKSNQTKQGLPVPPKLILEKGTQSGMESAMKGHMMERQHQNKLNNHLNGGTKNKIPIELPQTHGVENRGISGNDNSMAALKILSQAQANKVHDQVGPSSSTKKGGRKTRRRRTKGRNRKTKGRKTKGRKTKGRNRKTRKTKRFRKRSRN